MMSMLLKDFKANKDAYASICKEIEENYGSLIPQPVIIIGETGSGKTTLLHSIVDAFKDRPCVWIKGRSIFSSADIIGSHSFKKNSLLIIDDMDYFFQRCDYQEQYKLRNFLYNEGAPMLIGTCSKILPALTEYKAPFFEGVKLTYLFPISVDELTSYFDNKSFQRVVLLFELTSHTIKSLQLIDNIINTNPTPQKDLDLFLTYYTDIFTDIYRSNPKNSQIILNILSQTEDGMTIPEMRNVHGVTANILTAYLKSLRKQGIVSADKSVKKRTKYYIKDALFRIWLKQLI